MTNPDQPTSNNDRLITIPDAAGILRVSERTVYRLINGGRLRRPIKLGRASRLRESDVFALFDDFNGPTDEAA